MSITAEQIARREIALLEAPDRVPVSITMAKVNGIMLPRKRHHVGEDTELRDAKAVFKIWTFGDNQIIEKACRYSKNVDGRNQEYTDVNEMRRLMVKRSLLSWSLPIPIERENGWLTTDSYERVGSVPAPLMEALVYEFEKTFMVTESEEETVNRQCAVLFNRGGRGVTDACDAISMFCSYGNFNEKFGMSKEDMAMLPFKDYQLLRMVMTKEGESVKRDRNKKDHHAGTRIAMGGTKPRASRGKRIAL